MSAAAPIARESVARVGALVRAADRIDAAHTDRGRVLALNEHAPVALVRWACGCVSYVPLRRLRSDDGPPMAPCEVSGCANPRWGGLYCASHPRGAPSVPATKGGRDVAADGESFEPVTPAFGTPSPAEPQSAPSARNGGAIDDPRIKAGAATRTRRTPARAPRPGTVGARQAGAGVVVPPAPAAPKPRVKWTRERIVAALQAWAWEHGAAPNATDWRQAAPEYPCFATVYPLFGTWDAALAAAGLERDLRRRGSPRWTRENVIAALRAHHAAAGHSPSASSWARAADDHPTKETVRFLFGTWSAGLVAAGLPPAPLGRPRKRAT